MATRQARRYCYDCERKTLHAKETFGDGMGCLLTILTLGLFIPVWLLIGIIEAFKPFRCQRCGAGRLT